MSKEIYNKGFVMCKLPRLIQDAILEAHVLAAKNFKYNQNNNLDKLILEIEKLENNQEILETNFNAKSWEEVLNYYYNDQLEAIGRNCPYSFLDLV